MLSILNLIGTSIKAQVNYTYNENGNRIHREVYIGPPIGSRLAASAFQQGDKLDDIAKERAIKYGISLIPSGIKDLISIKISNLEKSIPATVYLFNGEGKVSDIKNIMTETEEHINLENLKSGIYILQVKIKDEYLFYKVIH